MVLCLIYHIAHLSWKQAINSFTDPFYSEKTVQYSIYSQTMTGADWLLIASPSPKCLEKTNHLFQSKLRRSAPPRSTHSRCSWAHSHLLVWIWFCRTKLCRYALNQCFCVFYLPGQRQSIRVNKFFLFKFTQLKSNTSKCGLKTLDK